MTSASPGRRTAFRLVVRADLDEALVSALGALRMRIDSDGPVALRGEFRDRAELLGALQALEGLGVELLEVTQNGEPAGGRSDSDGPGTGRSDPGASDSAGRAADAG